MSAVMLHEREEIPNPTSPLLTERLRVEGGWLYTVVSVRGITSTFIPDKKGGE